MPAINQAVLKSHRRDTAFRGRQTTGVNASRTMVNATAPAERESKRSLAAIPTANAVAITLASNAVCLRSSSLDGLRGLTHPVSTRMAKHLAPGAKTAAFHAKRRISEVSAKCPEVRTQVRTRRPHPRKLS